MELAKIRFILKLKTTILVVLGLTISSCQTSDKRSVPAIKNGAIDLSNWDLERDGTVNLNGKWGFYWGEQVEANSQIPHLKHTGFCNIPGYWTEEVETDTYFEQNGLATYHLKIILPDTVDTYALKLNTVQVAYSIWVDGKFLAKVGEPTKAPDTFIPSLEARRVPLPKKLNIDLFIQVASWEHRQGGGFIDPILIGTESQVNGEWQRNYNVQLMAFTFLIALSIYLLAFYFFYRNNPSYLYVAMFAFFGALRFISIDEMVIKDLIPTISYFWVQRFKIIGFYASSAFLLLAIDYLFREFALKLIRYGAYVLMGFSIASFIIPFQLTSYIMPLLHIISLTTALLSFLAIIKSILHKKNLVEATFFGIGGLVLLLVMIPNLLFYNNLTDIKISPIIAYVFFTFIQVLLLAYRNKKIYNTSNSLSIELAELNKGLEIKVEERTEEINAQKDQLSQQADALFEANSQLKDLDEAKNRFFANISHELRTPLTLILGGISRIKEEWNSRHKSVKLIENQSNLLHQQIDQLLDLTKLEAGKMDLNHTEQPIIKLLKGYLYSFESLASDKQIQLKFESNIEEAYLLLDRSILEKIIYNLLSNAYKFTPASGSITMTVEVNAESLNISVADTGIGISDEQIASIFNRFYQVDDSHKREYEGTGIGLALVKELIELYKGSISVESQIGHGTTFSLILPIKKVDHPKQQGFGNNDEVNFKTPIISNISSISDAAPLEDVAKSDKPIILVIEDHPDLQELISEGLEGEFEIMKAFDGEQGCQMAYEHIPDLIISDVMMPVKDGYEVCAELKQDERTSHIPIVLLTARTAQENKIQGLEAGADDYLAKPFDSQELSVRVRNLIANRKQLIEKFSEKQDSLFNRVDEVAKNPADKSFMHKLIEELEGNYTDENYSVDLLAEALHVSKSQLYRKLKAMTGVTPNKTLQDFRLQKAKSLLNNQELKVKEVGFMVGFASQAYFNKCFKDKFDITPKEFQNDVK